jgi:hypothetical protein
MASCKKTTRLKYRDMAFIRMLPPVFLVRDCYINWESFEYQIFEKISNADCFKCWRGDLNFILPMFEKKNYESKTFLSLRGY